MTHFVHLCFISVKMFKNILQKADYLCRTSTIGNPVTQRKHNFKKCGLPTKRGEPGNKEVSDQGQKTK